MTDVHVSLPLALRRALDLLADPPADPDVSKGYLDLLGAGWADDDAVPKNTGPIQAAWASPIGSMLYDNAQALSRRLISAWQLPIEWLNIPSGGSPGFGKSCRMSGRTCSTTTKSATPWKATDSSACGCRPTA